MALHCLALVTEDPDGCEMVWSAQCDQLMGTLKRFLTIPDHRESVVCVIMNIGQAMRNRASMWAALCQLVDDTTVAELIRDHADFPHMLQDILRSVHIADTPSVKTTSLLKVKCLFLWALISADTTEFTEFWENHTSSKALFQSFTVGWTLDLALASTAPSSVPRAWFVAAKCVPRPLRR